MSDPVLDELERKERLFVARAVFTAKVITWTALILLALIIEAALVFKVFHLEFVASAHADSAGAVQPKCTCSRRIAKETPAAPSCTTDAVGHDPTGPDRADMERPVDGDGPARPNPHSSGSTSIHTGSSP